MCMTGRPLLLLLLVLLLASLHPSLPGQTTFTGVAAEDLGKALLVLDLNGDGLAEIIAGAPRHSVEKQWQGRVVVIRGGTGDPSGRAASIHGGRPSDLFGDALAAGDVNGDGHPDLLVGAPGHGKTNGAAYLLFGGNKGGRITSDGVVADGTCGFIGSPGRGELGRAVAIGDLDGDGIGEVIVTEPLARAGTAPFGGRVLVFRGRKAWHSGGVAIGGEGLVPDLIIMGREGERLGHRLLTADVDGDGIHDLVITAPFYREGVGAVVVINGAKDLLASPKTFILDHDEPAFFISGNRGGRLGEAIAALDLDGDGRATLVVSEPDRGPLRSEKAGAVHAIKLDPDRRRIDLGRSKDFPGMMTWQGAVPFERLGAALWAGSLGSPATPALLVGSPSAGRVVLFLDPKIRDVAPKPSQAFMQSAKSFGASVAAGDVDGDGKTDIVIAAPDTNLMTWSPGS
jgi:hypothetical protein